VSATSMGSDMFPTADGSNARTSRRKRRVAIAGALALVVIAGAVVVGVMNAGDRAGSTGSAWEWWLVSWSESGIAKSKCQRVSNGAGSDSAIDIVKKTNTADNDAFGASGGWNYPAC
jgi:hypothetical protein